MWMWIQIGFMAAAVILLLYVYTQNAVECELYKRGKECRDEEQTQRQRIQELKNERSRLQGELARLQRKLRA